MSRWTQRPPLRSPPPTGIQATKTPLSFDGTGSSASGPGTIQHFTWDFGDGTAPVDTQTSAIASHSYNAAGVYTVRLTVKDDLGLTDTTTRTVTVDHPAAAFAVPPTPTPGASADFDASGSIDPEGSITDYSWDFGDGTPPVDAGTNPITPHSFTTRNTYQVTLTVTNNSGQTDQITQNVTVDNPPTASFTPSATVATPGTSLSFNGTASAPGDGGTIEHYIWDFGDGSPPEDTGITASDSHVYEVPGPHTVTLTVKDDLGITSTAPPQTVTIDQPTAAFTAPLTAVAPNSPASFDATGSSDPRGQHHRLQLGLRGRQWSARERDHDPPLQHARSLSRDAHGHQRQRPERPDHARRDDRHRADPDVSPGRGVPWLRARRRASTAVRPPSEA